MTVGQLKADVMIIFSAHAPEFVKRIIAAGQNVACVGKIDVVSIFGTEVWTEIESVPDFRCEFRVFVFFEQRFHWAAPHAKVFDVRA